MLGAERACGEQSETMPPPSMDYGDGRMGVEGGVKDKSRDCSTDGREGERGSSDGAGGGERHDDDRCAQDIELARNNGHTQIVKLLKQVATLPHTLLCSCPWFVFSCPPPALPPLRRLRRLRRLPT
eukprot:846357-Rhodomonas_salina.1